MNANNMHWMNYSINISKGISQTDLQVGAVLVSEYNKLVCSNYTGEECKVFWCSALLNKIRKLKIFNVQSVYITVNTLSATSSFDLSELLNEVHINEIYVGLPDPALTSYLADDPIITYNCVFRYPDELQREILEQNDRFFAASEQNIKYNHTYSENRISNLVIEKLKSRGFLISGDDLNVVNRRSFTLASLICNRYRIEYEDAISTVHNAISEAFNSKYSTYNYSDDARSLDLDWKESFMSFYKRSTTSPISTINILNIGVGCEHEAIALFSNCTSITFVDIAQDGLKKIKEQIPLSNIIVSDAADLSAIPDNSYDLYVSLRTYNSSFFDIEKAISEAYRVLKLNAVIIVSVANGFLYHERQSVIPGLIIPGTEFVDIYRGMDTVNLIHTQLLHAGFNDIKLFRTNTEIYLSAVKQKINEGRYCD
jgi:SAM-dependent methyltransferase